VIATRQRMPYMPFAFFWQARSAVTSNISEPPYHGPTRPLHGDSHLRNVIQTTTGRMIFATLEATAPAPS